jgi:DNA repair protein RecN (Recombination protein N)
MLLRLKIQNFALVEDLEITLDRGMSVLTGETGAGKSVIVTALGLVLGDRADREHIRHGATRATVEATFSTERMSRQFKSDFGDYLDDGNFTVTRDIARDGSSKVRINGFVATVARLRELASPLAEILGQHSNRLLLDEENHLLFLDDFAGVSVLRTEVGELYTAWDKVRTELRSILRKRDELERERELLLFQKEEIDRAEIRVGEENELDQERRILDSSRALIESAGAIVAVLGGEDQSAIEAVRLARKELDKMVSVDESLASQARQIEEIDYLLEDLRGFVEKYGASVPDDPGRLEEINQRLDEIYQLKQKYGGSEEVILKARERIRQKLKDRPDTSALISRLEADEQACRTAYSEKALHLSEVRRKAARYLQTLVIKEMADLAIDKGKFDSEFVCEEQADGIEVRGQSIRPREYGLESCRFLFSANPGEPLKSLVKTASGGEISRLLLALKAAEKKNNELSHSLLVFDEVDAGIGGHTAIEVGQKIKALAGTSQVIVITHLHQIARLADHHYLAEKTGGRGKRVTIKVTKLDGVTLKAELDRMVALPPE